MHRTLFSRKATQNIQEKQNCNDCGKFLQLSNIEKVKRALETTVVVMSLIWLKFSQHNSVKDFKGKHLGGGDNFHNSMLLS